jgi:DNA repair protein RadC
MSTKSFTAYESKTIARALRVMERALKTPGELLSSPTMVREYLMLRLAALEIEVFMVLMVDSQNRLIEARELFRGTLSQTAVYPREVVKAALIANAAAVILAHFVPRNRMRIMCPGSFCGAGGLRR